MTFSGENRDIDDHHCLWIQMKTIELNAQRCTYSTVNQQVIDRI